MQEKYPNLIWLKDQIRTLRTKAGYSQDDFAYETGLDRSHYSSIERGEKNVAAINLISIAKKCWELTLASLFPQSKTLPDNLTNLNYRAI